MVFVQVHCWFTVGSLQVHCTKPKVWPDPIQRKDLRRELLCPYGDSFHSSLAGVNRGAGRYGPPAAPTRNGSRRGRPRETRCRTHFPPPSGKCPPLASSHKRQRFCMPPMMP